MLYAPLTRPGSATPAFLPPKTLVLLVAVAPTSLTYFPPLTLEESGASQGLLEKPSFRLLGTGDGYGRSRNTGRAEVVDTSDEYYHRLHRFPEILEKVHSLLTTERADREGQRSAKAERERLIHERSKLILEIEDMRGRGWVYSGDQGGRGEVDRKRKLKEAEERLARFVPFFLATLLTWLKVRRAAAESATQVGVPQRHDEPPARLRVDLARNISHHDSSRATRRLSTLDARLSERRRRNPHQDRLPGQRQPCASKGSTRLARHGASDDLHRAHGRRPRR